MSYKSPQTHETTQRDDRLMVSKLMKGLRRGAPGLGEETGAVLDQVKASPKGKPVSERQRMNFALMELVPALRKQEGDLPPYQDMDTLVKASLEVDAPEGPSAVLHTLKDELKRNPSCNWRALAASPAELEKLHTRGIDEVSIIPANAAIEGEGPDLEF